MLRSHAERGEHPIAGFDHSGRAAEVVLQGCWMGMRVQVLGEDNVMNEAAVAGPAIFRERRREREVKRKVGERSGEGREIIFIEDFLARARAIPETDFAVGCLCMEQPGNMRTERGHAGTAADIDHFALGGLDVEVAEGADGGDDVTGFEVENIARSDAGGALLTNGWRGNAHIESELTLGCGVAGDGVVVAAAGMRIRGDEIENVLIAPDRGKGFRDIEASKGDGIVGWDFELEIVAGSEVDCGGTLRFKNQLFDERGHAVIADHAETESGLRAEAYATRMGEIDADLGADLLDGIRGKAAADGGTGGRAVGEIEAAVVFGAFDRAAEDEAFRKMGVTVSA